MSNDVVLKMKQKQYEATIIEFVQSQKGHFIAVTGDQTFLAALRTMLTKHLALTQPELFTWVAEPTHILRVINDTISNGRLPLLFIERIHNGTDQSQLVRQLKIAYPQVYVIVLTVDVEKHRIMYLHEVGADNFIAKPVSSNTLVEKLAFTIRPQTKLGQVIDVAKSMLAQEQYEKARQLAMQILEMKPGSAAGLMLLGDAEKNMGNIPAAREAYESASKNADLFLEPLRKLAELAEEIGDDENRLKYLERLDRLSPLNADRKVNIGEIHLSMGNTQKADLLFEAAIDQATKDALLHVGAISTRIAAMYADKDPEKSEKFLRRALAAKGKFLSHDDIVTFNQLGITLRQQGRWLDAITEYKKALQVAPEDENLYYNMGMAYAEGKDFAEARKCMVQALKLNSNFPYASPSIAYNLGVVFLQAGARDQSRQCLNIALELSPEMDIARKALAKLG